jgi:hypothetical protein
MKCRNITLSAATAALTMAIQAFAMEPEYRAANESHIRLQHVTPTVIVSQDAIPRDLPGGVTNIDIPKRLTCHSPAGCLITAKVWIALVEPQSPKVSAYLDNVAMEPTVPGDISITQQSALVSAGTHIVQTKVTQTYKQGTIAGWNIEYAKYEVPVVPNGH